MRTILRAFLIVLLFVAVGFLLLGIWTGASFQSRKADTTPRSVGTSGSIDVERARQRGAEVGEKAAVAASKVSESMTEAAVTTKIKAKMALDDLVKARTIDVTTSGSTVTLSGTVDSAAERERAVKLARETAGVTRVVDNLKVR
jgi:hyperosmotically inducible periplasmic protein